MLRTAVLIRLSIAILLCAPVDSLADGPRRPVDVCFAAANSSLLVVCERSAELLQLDSADGRVLSRLDLGGVPVSVTALSDDSAVVTDRQGGRLIFVQVSRDGLRIETVIDGLRDAVAVDQGISDELFVAGLWSRKVTCLDTTDKSAVREKWQVSLEFSPGNVKFLEAEKTLIATDHFGSQIAFLDPLTGQLKRQVVYSGHRLRGLADDPDGQRLLMSHQMLHPTAQATTTNITWGMMVSNDLYWLDRSQMVTGSGDAFYEGGNLQAIGFVGKGGADPNDVAVSGDGIVVVAIGGMNQVAVGVEDDYEFARLPVGTNPVAVAIDAKGDFAWVANRLDDTLTKVDIRNRNSVDSVALSPDWNPSKIDLGERLFHSSRFSHQHWMTCASCHPGGHAVNERAENLSDGGYESPKRVLSLLGRSGTPPFGWVGQDAHLEDQIVRSVKSTMQGSRTLKPNEVAQLAAFVRSLQPPPTAIDTREPSVAATVSRGAEIFRREQCGSCHTPPLYTSSELYDVGLDDGVGNTEFNPPSLIGIGQRGPRFFHDLRAESLEDIFSKHNHPLETELTEAERRDLVTFLKSL